MAPRKTLDRAHADEFAYVILDGTLSTLAFRVGSLAGLQEDHGDLIVQRPSRSAIVSLDGLISDGHRAA